MTAPIPIPITDDGQGYWTSGGVFVNALAVAPLPAQTFPAGVTIGTPFELGRHRMLSLLVAVTAKSGTNPTLDLNVETSDNGSTDWQSVGTFAQKTDVGLAVSAVSSTGTTPPVITLSGTATMPMSLKVEALTPGVLATWTGQYSADGGVTWVSFTSAATVEVVDPYGIDTGIALNIAAGAAATDNVWTASTSGYERKRFAGLGRFARVVALVGGSATPTVTASVVGEAV